MAQRKNDRIHERGLPEDRGVLRSMKPLDVFTKAYIEAALWSSNDNSDESGGEPLDKNYGLDDIAEETLEEMVRDCENFQRENEKYIPVDLLSNAGHDFWLTRNGHG